MSGEYGTFFAQFRERFHDTGAIAPSSSALAAAMTGPLRQGAGPGTRVLEVGAGTGVFTRAIVALLAPGDRLDVYEINPAFGPFLSECLSAARPGVECNLEIANLLRQPPAPGYDFIVSGLPLNNFAPEEVETILDLYMELLRPGGVLSYFEYIALRGLKQMVVGGEERRRLSGVAAVADRFLRSHPSRAVPVALNLPPAWARHVVRA